jgi:energy-coupling factor transporter ATP-binding protein EcfA2
MFYIKHIWLKNIRGFRKLNLPVSSEGKVPRMRTLILGRNGTCKSTLLRCIAIGLCDLEDGNSLVAEPIGRLITEDAKTAEIRIELVPDGVAEEPYSITTTLEIRDDKEVVANQDKPPPVSFVCGYGAGRSTEGPEPFRKYRIIDSVYTLFQYDEPMIGTELTLRRLRDYLGTKKYSHTMKGIKKALGLAGKDKIELPKGGGVIISGPSIGKNIPLEGWADGYRMTFNWLIDFYGRAMRANNVTPSGGIEGILLLDELEQHLHPSMQTDILARLSNLFPELQIFVTTHSPLVALGAFPEELVVLRRKRKYVYSEDFIPDFRGYSAEDMLVDERLFDTGVYSPDTNKKLTRYRKLAGVPKNKRTRAQIEELRLLARELRSQQLPEVRESPLAEELRKFRQKFDL